MPYSAMSLREQMVESISDRVVPVSSTSKNRNPLQRMALEDEGGQDYIEDTAKERHVQ